MSQMGSLATVSLLGAVDSLTGNIGGVVLPDGGGNINVVGGNNITTVGNLSPNTLTVNVSGTTDNAVQIGNALGSLSSIAVGTNGQVLIGATGADPAFASLTSTDGSIVFTPGVNTLDLSASGAMAEQFDGDTGSAVPALGVLNIIGGALGVATVNIMTEASGNTVEVDLKDDVTLLGFLVALGNVSTGSNFNMPATTADGLHGIFIHDGNRFIHTFGTNNTFMGADVSNLTGAGSGNVGIGAAVMQSFGGSNSVAVGFAAMSTSSSLASNSVAVGFEAMSNSNGDHAVAIGAQALDSALGDYNIGIGFQAGQNVTGSSNILISNAGGAESNTIRIGTTGAGNGQQNRAFIAGISGVNVGSVATVVSISGDQLGQATITAGTGITVTPGANSITIATSNTPFTWTEVTGTSQAMAVESGYIANNAGLVTLTLPAVAALGSVIRVTGKGAGGWRIAQNAGQTIYFGTSTTTTGATGRLDSTATRDTVELVCVTANNDFNVLSSIGNITVT